MSHDAIILGGGLAGSILAWRWRRNHPDLGLLLIEAEGRLGGNHTWSFHETDLTREQLHWVRPLLRARWPAYEVAFPAFTRRVGLAYASLDSPRLDATISRDLGASVLTGRRGVRTERGEVRLDDGTTLSAQVVIDATGFGVARRPDCGFQKFHGLELTLYTPHGLTQPVLMDGRCRQVDGFRFLYFLPWDDETVLVEDTCYSDTPEVNEARCAQSILDEARRRGWGVRSVVRRETGSLPIPLTSAPPPDTSLRIGVAGGFFHPVTGYSLPAAVRVADRLAAVARGPGFPERVAQALREVSGEHRDGERYLHFLNRLMFLAADPEDRLRLMEHFYRLPDPSIARFYAGALTWTDRLRILAGKPPVPIHRALACLRAREGAAAG